MEITELSHENRLDLYGIIVLVVQGGNDTLTTLGRQAGTHEDEPSVDITHCAHVNANVRKGIHALLVADQPIRNALATPPMGLVAGNELGKNLALLGHSLLAEGVLQVLEHDLETSLVGLAARLAHREKLLPRHAHARPARRTRELPYESRADNIRDVERLSELPHRDLLAVALPARWIAVPPRNVGPIGETAAAAGAAPVILRCRCGA